MALAIARSLRSVLGEAKKKLLGLPPPAARDALRELRRAETGEAAKRSVAWHSVATSASFAED